jgi:hypothetical protein
METDKMLGRTSIQTAGTASQEIEQMAAKGPPIGVRVPPEVRVALERLAKADDRSISYVINKIVAEYLRAKKLIK